MKQLRILTGRHAGAHIRLTQTRYRIGPDDEADLQISDWNSPPLVATLEEGQAVTLLCLDASGATTTPAGTLEDLQPRRFGDVVLCIGPEQARWPSDMALLERLVQEGAKAAAAARPKGRRGALIGVAALGAALLAGGLALVGQTARDAEAKAPPEPLLRRVERAVAHSGVNGVGVRALGGQIEVDGLLPGAAEVARLRAALAGFSGEPIAHRYASAADVAQSIADALGDKRLSVAYAGDGVFAIDGQAADLLRVRDAAQRIATDLGPLVRRLEVAATELPSPERVPVGSMLAGDDLQYVQTRDGVKHLSLKPLSLPEETHRERTGSGASTPRSPSLN
ncbi:FHA domain-containing protein [Aquabacterium sp. A7-Y]|uniref:HrpD5 family protein n=1 Tax=Aquabacterium sp. A7-Y TaxID=1349605 RepID=UPI00223D5941|nr:HrpD5 family protein [Aquabacterium sp. A7-Y]MCW7540276.1 FHA domain-containing protein [Aquabacterium sp. A7-Y]